jgi:rubredoxin
MTLGNAAAAQVRLIVWCKGCGHQLEPDPAQMAARYGAETPVPDWREKWVCSKCGGRQVDW